MPKHGPPTTRASRKSRTVHSSQGHDYNATAVLDGAASREANEKQAQQLADRVSGMAPRSAAPIVQAMQPRRSGDTAGALDASFEAGLVGSKGRGRALAPATQHRMARSFQSDFSAVRIHTDRPAIQLSQSIGARAFTHGRDIYFNRGEYQPESASGQHLLAHELTHVVQQTGRVQRKVNPTPSAYQGYAALAAMTIRQLDDYAKAQADWHTEASLSTTQRDEIRGLLLLVRDQGRLSLCGGMTVSSGIAELKKSGPTFVAKYLDLLNLAYTDGDPFQMSDPMTDMGKAVKKGKDLADLKKGFPAYVLKTAMQEGRFNVLHDNSFIQDLVKYYTTATNTPIFQAKNGKDFRSYNNQRATDKVDPLSYDVAPLRGKVRSFHRFKGTALDQLKTNFADTSKSKPLTLILHTALDYNGAFHRDKNLTEVIKNANMNTLMVEGKETLADFRREISPIAQKYGINNKIDQLMFAGHGNARFMELAGKIKDDGKGEVEEVVDNISLNTNKVEPDKLMKEVLQNMDKKKLNKKGYQAHRRIIFNACLTNSNSVRQAIQSKNVLLARLEIIKYIRQNASLATYMQDLAKSEGRDVTAVGSNASFGKIGLIDGADNLDLISGKDSKLTGTKLEYVEFGGEASGALRAVLESWARHRKLCKAAMERRIKISSTAWNPIIIETLYQRILKNYWSDAENIRQMVLLGETISKLKSSISCRVSNIKGKESTFPQEYISLMTALQGSKKWSSDAYVGLVMYQAWMTADPASTNARNNFLHQLQAHFTANTALKYVDLDYLDTNGHYAKLLSAKGNGPMILALMGILYRKAPAGVQTEAKKYLLSEVNAKDEFDAVKDVTGKLGGRSTELGILQAIGKYTPPSSSGSSSSSSSSSGVSSRDANLRIEGQAQNTAYVDSVTYRGEIKTKPEAAIYQEPSTGSTKLSPLSQGTTIDILGSTAGWWAIEYTYTTGKAPVVQKPGTAFVKKSEVKLI